MLVRPQSACLVPRGKGGTSLPPTSSPVRRKRHWLDWEGQECLREGALPRYVRGRGRMRAAASAEYLQVLCALHVLGSDLAQLCCAGLAVDGYGRHPSCRLGPGSPSVCRPRLAASSAPLCQCGRWLQSLPLAREARAAGTRPLPRRRLCIVRKRCCLGCTPPRACPGGAASSSPLWPCAALSRFPWRPTSITSWPR